MTLDTKPYKGSRDFYPEDKRKQNYIFGKIRQIVERFGYEEYDAPLIEPLELYKAKSGEEIVNEQTYNFIDRGGRAVAIRPEMTPSVSRMVAARRQELAYPLRWYSIPNLWRYERPQKGRLREHWQLNVDIFGIATIAAEQEVIRVADAVYKAFGATRSMYVIKVNHRELSEYIFKKYLKLNEAQAYSMAKVIDRSAKLDRALFLEQIDLIFTPSQREEGATERLMAVLSSKNISQLPKDLQSIKPVRELVELLNGLTATGIDNLEFDVSLMRGFDYYSGIVFEVFDNHPDNNRSMMGGGRYDGLVGLFGVEPVPTVGFGLGDATLANFLELHSLMPDIECNTDIYLSIVGDVKDRALIVAEKLREMGVNVAIDFSDKKIGAQLKTAQKKKIRYVVIVGENELKSGEYTLRDLINSSEEKHSLERIVTIVLDRRSR